MKKYFTKNRIISIVAIIFIIAGWKIISVFNNSILLPSPEKTLITTFKIITQKNFIKIVGSTLIRGLIGILFSVVLGLIIGTIAGIKKTVFSFINPFLVILRSVPVISFILLALIWLNTEFIAVFIGFLIMFPVITINVTEGIKDLDKGLLKMAKSFKVPKSKLIREVYFPHISSFLISGISTAIGFGWKAIIIGEVLSLPKFGIGTFMQNAQMFLLVDELFAWTIIAVLISALFEYFIRYLEHKLIFWK